MTMVGLWSVSPVAVLFGVAAHTFVAAMLEAFAAASSGLQIGFVEQGYVVGHLWESSLRRSAGAVASGL